MDGWKDARGSSPTDAAVTFVGGRGDCREITSAEDCHDGWKMDGSCPYIIIIITAIELSLTTPYTGTNKTE